MFLLQHINKNLQPDSNWCLQPTLWLAEVCSSPQQCCSEIEPRQDQKDGTDTNTSRNPFHAMSWRREDGCSNLSFNLTFYLEIDMVQETKISTVNGEGNTWRGHGRRRTRCVRDRKESVIQTTRGVAVWGNRFWYFKASLLAKCISKASLFAVFNKVEIRLSTLPIYAAAILPLNVLCER